MLAPSRLLDIGAGADALVGLGAVDVARPAAPEGVDPARIDGEEPPRAAGGVGLSAAIAPFPKPLLQRRVVESERIQGRQPNRPRRAPGST